MKTINNIKDFKALFAETFGNIDRGVFREVGEGQTIGVELGGQGNDIEQRLLQAINRSSEVLRYCFEGKSVWLKIILWTDEEERNLVDAGFKIDMATTFFKQKDEYDILYLHFNRYSKRVLLPLAKSNINYDMKVDPCAQITCFYINFKSKLLINIYDDRGLDIYSSNKKLLNDIKDKFFDWLI